MVARAICVSSFGTIPCAKQVRETIRYICSVDSREVFKTVELASSYAEIWRSVWLYVSIEEMFQGACALSYFILFLQEFSLSNTIESTSNERPHVMIKCVKQKIVHNN